MADCSVLLQQGLSLIHSATANDASGNYREALRLYILALEAFTSVLRAEKNTRVTGRLKEKMKEYMARAEELKQFLASGGPSGGNNVSDPFEFPTTPKDDPTIVPTKQAVLASPLATTTTSTTTALSSPVPPQSRSAPSGSSLPSMPSSQPIFHDRVIKIQHGQIGCSYESLFGSCIDGATEAYVIDPYLRSAHQLINLLRLCELFVKKRTIRKVYIVTSEAALPSDASTDISAPSQSAVQTKFAALAAELHERGIELFVSYREHIHDREIRFNNGWVVSIGRGLDIYQRPKTGDAGVGKSFFIGSGDYDLRPCLETTVQIYKQKM